MVSRVLPLVAFFPMGVVSGGIFVSWLLSQGRVDGIDSLSSHDSLCLPSPFPAIRSFFVGRKNSRLHTPGWDGDHLRERFLERAIRRRPGQENSF